MLKQQNQFTEGSLVNAFHQDEMYEMQFLGLCVLIFSFVLHFPAPHINKKRGCFQVASFFFINLFPLLGLRILILFRILTL